MDPADGRAYTLKEPENEDMSLKCCPSGAQWLLCAAVQPAGAAPSFLSVCQKEIQKYWQHCRLAAVSLEEPPPKERLEQAKVG